jgi:16S rRNA (adenine1518-N6/adenine1519-N6)-dimethyltransferase
VTAIVSDLLGPAQIRRLATELAVRPTKSKGQNFMHDANTVRRIVRLAGLGPQDTVVEVGPGLGSLTLALLETGAEVLAVEVDRTLADALPGTVARRCPAGSDRLQVITDDALRIRTLPVVPTAFVANLPYNIAVPVLLTFLERFETLAKGLVLVQAEVAERLAARPGEPAYGIPSAKAAWYAQVDRAGTVPRSVFWPVPNVDSGLVSFTRRPRPTQDVSPEAVFACVDAAFSQRRKTLRAALAVWAGSAAKAEQLLREAGVDPRSRGERLSVTDFAAIAAAHERSGPPEPDTDLCTANS